MTKGDAAPGETNMFAGNPGMNKENQDLARHLGSPDFIQKAFQNPGKPGETMSYAEMRDRYG
jgi:hypothetical protein